MGEGQGKANARRAGCGPPPRRPTPTKVAPPSARACRVPPTSLPAWGRRRLLVGVLPSGCPGVPAGYSGPSAATIGRHIYARATPVPGGSACPLPSVAAADTISASSHHGAAATTPQQRVADDRDADRTRTAARGKQTGGKVTPRAWCPGVPLAEQSEK